MGNLGAQPYVKPTTRRPRRSGPQRCHATDVVLSRGRATGVRTGIERRRWRWPGIRRGGGVPGACRGERLVGWGGGGGRTEAGKNRPRRMAGSRAPPARHLCRRGHLTGHPGAPDRRRGRKPGKGANRPEPAWEPMVGTMPFAARSSTTRRGISCRICNGAARPRCPPPGIGTRPGPARRTPAARATSRPPPGAHGEAVRTGADETRSSRGMTHRGGKVGVAKSKRNCAIREGGCQGSALFGFSLVIGAMMPADGNAPRAPL
jgi:hypothetical protein